MVKWSLMIIDIYFALGSRVVEINKMYIGFWGSFRFGSSYVDRVFVGMYDMGGIYYVIV